MEFDTIASTLGLEESEFSELVRLFIDVSRTDLERLESGLSAGNADQVIEAAHSIKGAALNLGLKDISAIARNVEMNARNRNLSGARESIPAIRNLLARIERFAEPL